MKRWYDHHEIGKYLEYFKGMSKKDRDPIINEILGIINKDGISIIDHSVMEFPLEPWRRRWYDKDPALWIVFNGLEHADIELLNQILCLLQKKLPNATAEPINE